MQDKYELAWAAGFFDGEGSTSISKIKGWMRLLIQIGQCEVTTLMRFQKAIGCGTINGPYQVKEYKPIWRLSVRGYEAGVKTLELLWPFLSEPKKLQARKCLDIATLEQSKPRIPYNKRYPGRTNMLRDNKGRFIKETA